MTSEIYKLKNHEKGNRKNFNYYVTPKYLVIIFYFFFCFNGIAQTYHSNYTIYLPQGIQEDLQRTITIRDDIILIDSYKNNINVNNQVWKIHNRREDKMNLIFNLVSLDETNSIHMFIKKEKLQYIEVLQPLENGGTQRLQLNLETLN